MTKSVTLGCKQYKGLSRPAAMAMLLSWIFSLLTVSLAAAQTANTQNASRAERLLEIAGTELPSAEATKLPSRGTTSAGNVGDIDYELRERPSTPAQVNLSTTVETHVENRTSHTIGSDRIHATEAAKPRAPLKEESRSALEFREWVLQTVGSDLPVYGDGIFRDGSNLSDVDPMTVPADYRIGPGDQLLIHAWGQIEIDFQGPVSRSGTVFLNGIGDIAVAGLPLSEARDLIRGVISTQYRDFELTLSLAKLRSIRIYLSGFVDSPGVHTVPSTATALYGLLASGGPSSRADLRRIELRRGGRTVAVFDSYRFMIEGDKTADPQLQPGDILHLPPARGFVAIAGSVRRPAIYHLDADPTLKEVLNYAGGTTVSADLLQARIERIDGGRRTVVRVEGDPRQSETVIRDGDIVLLVPMSPRFEASITVTGHVAVPLRQPWRQGMTVSDALPNADALMPYSTWSERNARNPLSAVGATNRGANSPAKLAEVDWDHAAIERIDHKTKAVARIEFDIGAAIAAPHGNADPTLQAGDIIVVYAKDAFAQPERKRRRLVRIEGEVVVPGIYSMGVEETLQDAIARAGGPTNEAYLYGTVLTRASARAQEAQRLRQVVDSVEEDYYRFLATRSRDVVSQEDAMVSGTESGNARAVITRLRALEPTGRVVFALEKTIDEVSELPSIPLEDDDTIRIPRRSATITVTGAVFQQGTILWKRGADADDYLRLSGGLRPHADRSEIVVMHADGSVRPVNRGFGSTKINPGDSILVPEDVGRTTLGRKLRDWTTLLYQLTLGAAAISVLKD